MFSLSLQNIKKPMGGNIMDNAFKMVLGLVGKLTEVLVAVLGLGIVGALVFGDMGMGIDVIGNITALVENLTSMGVVGLIVIAILMSLVK